MSELLDAVRAGRTADVPRLVALLGARERRGELRELKALRVELRGQRPDGGQDRPGVRAALLVAGAGCQAGAVAAAAWIGAAELRGDGLPYGPLGAVLAGRDPAWVGQVAHRLAGRTTTAREDYPLISELVRTAGCPMPTGEVFVRGWAERTARTGDVPLTSALRADPHSGPMVLGLLATADELPVPLLRPGGPEDPASWPSALARLSREGVLEREALLATCVARLRRGGRRAEMTFFLRLLRGLEPTAEEERARTDDWIRMACDGPSAVAGQAQSALARLARRGELAPTTLAELSRAVLFRREKTLVVAHLVLLGRVLRNTPGAAAELLPVIAEAFAHRDTDVQGRALRLTGRHLPSVEGDLRARLAGCAVLLSPVHRPRAAEVFGGLPAGPAADHGVHEEKLPPPPEPVRQPSALAGAAEVAAEVAALCAPGWTVSVQGWGTLPAFERTLDGLVRRAHTDRTALAEGLRTSLAGRTWSGDDPLASAFGAHARRPDGVERVAAAVLDAVSVRALWDANARLPPAGRCVHAGLEGVVEARLREIAYRVRTRSLPFLLATPTWTTGALDPGDLVERLRVYRRLGVLPAPVDFAQALLRLRRGGGDPEAARAAAALGTSEGDRLAALLRDGTVAPGLPAGEETGRGGPSGAARRRIRSGRMPGRTTAGTEEHPLHRRDFPRPFHWLASPHPPVAGRCDAWHRGSRSQWPGVLPEDRETLAAWMMSDVAACADQDRRGGAWWLPSLAAAGGPAGPAVHLAVAYGLGARHPGDRLAAVDALLTLAARRHLGTRELGETMASLVISGTVRLNRLGDSARTAAATGAYRTVWSTLDAALPALLMRGSARPGLGEFLSVAAECAEHGGATGRSAGMPALTAVAARGGTSRLMTQAARLLAALRQ